MAPRSRGLGRVERALEVDLSSRADLGAAERTALRAQAHAVDIAEGAEDAELITTANRGYLVLRTSAGLTSAGTKPADAFDTLLADILRPSPGISDTTNA
jgi:hypothetical protein